MQDGTQRPVPPRQPVRHSGGPVLRIRGEPGIILRQDEAMVFLLMSAWEYDATACSEYPCEVCDAFVRMWHDVYQALTADARLRIEIDLEDADCPSPRYPREVR